MPRRVRGWLWRVGRPVSSGVAASRALVAKTCRSLRSDPCAAIFPAAPGMFAPPSVLAASSVGRLRPCVVRCDGPGGQGLKMTVGLRLSPDLVAAFSLRTQRHPRSICGRLGLVARLRRQPASRRAYGPLRSSAFGLQTGSSQRAAFGHRSVSPLGRRDRGKARERRGKPPGVEVEILRCKPSTKSS